MSPSSSSSTAPISSGDASKKNRSSGSLSASPDEMTLARKSCSPKPISSTLPRMGISASTRSVRRLRPSFYDYHALLTANLLARGRTPSPDLVLKAGFPVDQSYFN